MVLPSNSGEWKYSGISFTSVVIMWFGRMSLVRSNQNLDIWVRTFALVCYGVVEDHIKAADAVGGYHDQAVTIVIDFAYLSFFNRFHLFIPRCA